MEVFGIFHNGRMVLGGISVALVSIMKMVDETVSSRAVWFT